MQALLDSHYIDSDGHIQADIVALFPELSKEFGKSTLVKNVLNPLDKGYVLFGEKYGLEIIEGGSVGTQARRPWFIVNVKNRTEDKTVDGFDLVYYGTSVYGDIIKFDDDAKLVHCTFVKNIKPGKTYLTEKIFFYDSSQQPKIIHAALRKIHYRDGTTVDIPLRDLCFFDYEITY